MATTVARADFTTRTVNGDAAIVGLHLMLRGIETERLEALDDLRLDGVVEQRVDEDDAVCGRQRPGGMDFGADEVEVVEH